MGPVSAARNQTSFTFRSDLVAVHATKPSQIKALRVLTCGIWREYFPGIISADQVEYMLHKMYTPDELKNKMRDGELFFLIKSRNRYVGYFSYFLNPQAGWAQLRKLFLRKETRRNGIGNTVLMSIVEICRAADINRIWLAVNKRNVAAIGAWERLGFRISDEEVIDIDGGFVMDDYIMEKSL